MIATLLAAALSVQPELVRATVPRGNGARVQAIAKGQGDKDWPFVADGGKLVCVPALPQPVVFFMPDGDGISRPFLLDVNPYWMLLYDMGLKNVLLPYDKPEELIRRIAPFVAMGHTLCEQKKSPTVPGGEL
jgi:hypothetical protein